MAIKYDSGGFIIGERRLKEMSEGILKTEDNTSQILKVLTDDLQQYTASNERIAKEARSDRERQNRDARSVSGSNEVKKTRRTAEAAIDLAEAALETSRQANKKRQGRDGASVDSVGSSDSSVTSVRERTQQERKRDANGRFTSGDAETKGIFSFLKKFKSGVGLDGVGNVDASGVDPTVDAIRELKDVTAPVGRVFFGMGARAIGLMRGRLKKRRSDEVLPQEQVEANKEDERSSRQRNSLLRKLIDAVRANGGGSGGGITGLLGGLGRGKGLLSVLLKGGKGLLKRVPLLGALVGGGLLAKDWNKLDNKGRGKGIGSIAGMGIGGVLGSFLGPVGTIGGAMLGEKLGSIFGEKVGGWVDHLKDINFGEIFKSVVSKVVDVGKNTFIPWKLGTAVGNGVSSLWDGAKNLGRSVFGGGDIGAATGNYAPLLDSIAAGEARGGAFGTSGYDAVYGGASIKPSKPISQMTVGEVKAYQQQLVNAGNKSTAVGRYQFIRNKGAFSKMAAEAGLKDTDIFDAKAQDALAIHYLGGKKNVDRMIKKGDGVELANKTSQVFASMKNASGRGTYDGDGLNTARHGGVAEMREVSRQVAANQANGTATVKAEQPKASNPKAKTQQAMIFKPGAPRPPAIQVPKVTPELAKIGKNITAAAQSRTPSDANVPQTVSDRSIAHVLSGGLGYDQHSA